METYTAENATLYKVPKNSHFTVISNKLLRSKKLNPKQKGLLLKVLSLPNTWRFSVSGIVRICKEGKSAIKARLAELTELGYHSKCESIIMDIVADKIDRKTLEIMFADLDELQEDYHNRLDDLR